MGSKIGLNVTKNYSYNFSYPKRDKKLIRFIIIHYTGMKKESNAIQRLTDLKSKVSAHYFIKNNGEIINLVPELFEAWHAGKSRWKSIQSLNRYSIGIEINNPGHLNGYRKFFLNQIFSLKKLLRHLSKKYKIKNDNVLGHSDIAPERKKDPGEKFPWNDLAKARLCKWHSLKVNEIKKFRNEKLSKNDQIIFMDNLYKIGYSKIDKKILKKNRVFVVKAFQRRYRQDLISGKIDKECFLISKNLKK
tara:strand:+ start:745 stop:1485 length:741 start_codon:yes stop_codon:yes gene_type:complete